MDFFDKLQARVLKADTLLCIGLDPRVPENSDPYDYIVEHNKRVITETLEYTACYKPNVAFYEAAGTPGLVALEKTLAMIPSDIPVIIDAKRGDIGATAEAYATAVFDVLGADAVTLSPYMGKDSAAPFLAYQSKGFFMLCRTSNPGASAIQELVLDNAANEPLFLEIARQAVSWSERIGLVVGGNDPESLRAVRSVLPDVWFLAPGIGAQGGSIAEAVKAGIRADGMGILPMVGRAVYSDDQPGVRAREFRDALNQARKDSVSAVKPVAPASSLKERICQGLVDAGCFQLGEFTLKSGVKSPFYIDMRKIQSDPRFLSLVGKAYAGLCRQIHQEQKTARIAGIPLAALPLATAASLECGLPLVYPRMSVKSHGTGKLVEGEYSTGEAVILLDDLITTGLSKIEAADILREAGLVVEDLVVLLERGTKGRKDMEEAGIRLHTFLHVDELFDYLLDRGLISSKKHQELVDFVRE